MGECFITRRGGGGSGLRLRIFGGTNAPSNPKNNDIWVKTSTAIGTWELSDKTMPISWAMPSGYVYIKGDFTGSYDYRETTGLALDVPGNHDCTMYARLTSCTQYDGSAWASKDAYVYHDGWHQFGYIWNGELLDNGEQYTAVTGGWNGIRYYWSSDLPGGVPSVTWADDGVSVQAPSRAAGSLLVTKEAIDLTRFSNLAIECTSASSDVWLLLSTGTGDQFKAGEVASVALKAGIIYLDISAFSGMHYIGIQCRATNSTKIKSILMK